jgi:glycosyltransferase involved in cell wall biosynthesis
MKIALIAPSPAPFQIGGAEKLFWGLQRYINAETEHVCELLKLPSHEQDFWSLVDAYARFSTLDVTHFDVVVSGKYPAWTVRHDNHVVYMLHRLRGLYDTYGLFGLPLEPQLASDAPASKFLAWLATVARGPVDATTLRECFERLGALRALDAHDDLARFPGPFARCVIRFLDDVSLAPGRIARYAAISRTVRDRADYFPRAADVAVLHPPSDLQRLGGGSDDYFFTVSRLDGAKRVSLIIDAMRHVDHDVPLLIAGTGPDEAFLRQRAAHDARIRFLGYVSDADVVGYYRDALAVPFVPRDEDYGLVTVEAMMCEKPVVTVTDSGGPTELVRHGETGACVAPDPRVLGLALNALCNDRGMARSLGRAARRVAERIDWRSVVSGLVPAKASARSATRRASTRKLTVVTTFPIHPPTGGGQVRVYELYRELASSWRIDVVSFAPAGSPSFDREIAPNLHEIRVAKSEAHERAEHELCAACGWIPVTDVAMPRLHALTPAFTEALERSVASSDAVVACHPYLVGPLVEAARGRPLWYEAQDVEIDLKESLFAATPGAAGLLEDTRRAESRCWSEAALVYACCDADLERLRNRYGASKATQLVVSNGVALREREYVSVTERASFRRRLGLEARAIAAFMGSWHPPNLRAVERVFEFARRCPDVAFLVLGSAGEAFSNRHVPPNVSLLGSIDEATKAVALSVASVALNPMESGSGTNLKMLDYCATGVPVISTPFGVRGLSLRDPDHVRIVEIDEFPDAIVDLLAAPASRVQAMCAGARSLIESEYDWRVVARRFRSRLQTPAPWMNATAKAACCV